MSLDASILVVEDEEQLARLLRSALIHAGHSVNVARTGREALAAIQSKTFDVMLLDLGLPDLDGQDIIVLTSTYARIPIIVVSARGSESEKIRALDKGARDYLAKPFDMDELLARIRAVLRTQSAQTAPARENQSLTIDFTRRQAAVNGTAVRLSGKEVQLLQLLVDANGAVVSHDELIQAIWGKSTVDGVLQLRVLTWQARRKIELQPSNPQHLISEPGLGYRLSLD